MKVSGKKTQILQSSINICVSLFFICYWLSHCQLIFGPLLRGQTNVSDVSHCVFVRFRDEGDRGSRNESALGTSLMLPQFIDSSPPPPPPTHPHPHPSIMFSTLKGKPGDVHPRTYKVKMMYACVCTRPFSGNIQHQNSTCFQ